MYLEIDEGFLDHPKTLRFCGLMQSPEAGIYLLRLWRWAVRSAPDGDLGGMEPYDVEIAVQYRALDGKCFGAMVTAGFIDAGPEALTIHNWQIRTGGAIRRMASKAERLRQKRTDNIPTRSGDVAGVSPVHSGDDPPSPVQSSQDKARSEPPGPPAGAGDPAGRVSYPEYFETAWNAYPKRRGTRHNAARAWAQLKPRPVLAAVVAGIEAWKLSPDWAKDGGDFIPAMSAWLRARGWETEPPRRVQLVTTAERAVDGLCVFHARPRTAGCKAGHADLARCAECRHVHARENTRPGATAAAADAMSTWMGAPPGSKVSG